MPCVGFVLRVPVCPQATLPPGWRHQQSSLTHLTGVWPHLEPCCQSQLSQKKGLRSSLRAGFGSSEPGSLCARAVPTWLYLPFTQPQTLETFTYRLLLPLQPAGHQPPPAYGAHTCPSGLRDTKLGWHSDWPPRPLSCPLSCVPTSAPSP